MSAHATTAAPTGRKKIAQGKRRSVAALGNDSPNASSPEGAKEGANQRGGLGKAHQLFGEQLPSILDELNLKLVA